MGVFEDTEDCGDEYNWSDLEKGEIITSAGEKATVEVAESKGMSGTLRITQKMRVPASLSEDRKSRSRKRVDLPIVTELTLRGGSRRLEIKTTVDNNVKDHRVRVLFPTPFNPEKAQVGGHFDTVERIIDPASQPEYVSNYDSPSYTTEHFGRFVRLGDDRRGLAVLARGICEYEALAAKTGRTIALTLFRSVGFLSRDDFRRRQGHASPFVLLPTPDAQMIGAQVFEYAIYPHEGKWQNAQLTQEGEEIAMPLLCECVGVLHQVLPLGTEKNVIPFPRKGTIPDTFSLISVKPGQLVLTTLKKADEGEEWIARFYNQTPQTVEGVVEFAFPAKKIWLADLSEKKEGKPVGSGRSIKLTVPGKKIVTLAVRF